MLVKRITFDTIKPIWASKIWLNRQSPIETHSAMTWPFDGDPEEYDMNIFNYEPSFWAVYDNEHIVGVNSGHRTSYDQYRSRGIWVDPEYRGQGIAAMLFDALKEQALKEECIMAWSIPRKTALPAYIKAGFSTVGDFIETETANANIYARVFL